MKTDTLVPLCKLFENVSKAGRKYFVGTLSYTTKLVLLQNADAKDNEPGWVLYVAEREPKPAGGARGPVER